MPIINSLFSWIIKKRIHQIELFMKYPHEVQLELFRNLMAAVAESEWCELYGYEDITTPDQFRERAPISDYNKYKP